MKNSELILKLFIKILNKSLELLFPSSIYCISCEKPITKHSCYSLCDDCLNALHWANKATCIRCGKPLEEWYPAELCTECVNANRSFDDGITCLQFNDKERKIIHDLKYHKKSYLSRIFSNMMYDKIDALDKLDDWDMVIPVPMYWKKEAKRGYNQAALLGKFLAKRLKIDFYPDMIIRVKDTVPMNKLGGQERRHNLDDAFNINEGLYKKIVGKRILLIDDIYTTGVTADKCSKLLKLTGAKYVTIITVASGKNQRELPDVATVEKVS